MILGILFYYMWIIIVWFLMYLLLRCAYEDKNFENKAKYPLWVYILCLVGSLVPGANLIVGVGLLAYIADAIGDRDLYIKHWLFKKY